MVLDKSDLDQIREVVLAAVSLETKPLKQDIEDIKQKVDLLPTKKEFFNSQDEVVKELQTVRQEQAALSHRSQIHTVQIQTLADQLDVEL